MLFCTTQYKVQPDPLRQPDGSLRIIAKSDFIRELSLKTLQVKDELQESNGQSRTLTARCVRGRSL